MARATKAPSATNLTVSNVSYTFSIGKSAVLVLLLSGVSLATRLALHPLFGRTSTSAYHTNILLVACTISVLLSQLPERTTLLALASLLGYAPRATYLLAVWSTRQWEDPRRATALVQGVVLVPVLGASTALMKQWNSPLVRSPIGPLSVKASMALATFSAVRYLEPWLQRIVPLGGVVNSSTMFVASAVGFTLLAALSAISALTSSQRPEAKSGTRSSSRTYTHTLPFLLPIFASALAFSQPPAASPSLPYTRQTPPALVTSSSASSSATVRLLARAHGPTGIIVVAEHVEEEFRFLRVDHSLLGGRWFGEKVAPDARNGLGDSIYTTFVLQEAARLVERKRRENETALFIGLGVGVAAEAFIAHGVDTTVVEIDPVVYNYARHFFGMPEPTHVHIEDARQWVQRYEGEKFDYVVHDCFSGGELPGHLFTVEFWAALQGIVMPDGVVAVNFAGRTGSDAARAMYLTLRRSFGTCRAFHDQTAAELDSEYSFFNIVFFCTPRGTLPPRFRVAKEKDFLVSHLRLHVLSGLREREVNASTVLGNVTYIDGTQEVDGEERWVLRDEANPLGEWQQESGVEHWEVMRQVLPDVFWETY